MFVSAVADPTAFDLEYFVNKDYRKEAKHFFEGVTENALLLVDPLGKLKDELVRKIEALPTNYGQHLAILLSEILKNKRNRIIKCIPDNIFHSGSNDNFGLCCDVARLCGVDAIIVSEDTINRFKMAGNSFNEIVPLSDYSESRLETRRRKLFGNLEPFGQMSDADANELLIRTVKFSKWIRFFDKQIGKGKRIRHFRSGIRHILKLWRDYGHFAEIGDGSVEIITCHQDYWRRGEPDYVREQKQRRNQERAALLMADLVRPLQEEFNREIKLRVKHDPQNKFHARYLQAQAAIVLFERGFDLFENDGRFKRAIVKVDNGSYEHLRQYRRLPE